MKPLPPRDDWATAFGRRVAARRRQLGYSLSELGERVGSHRQSVWRWEHGEQLPDAYDLFALSKALRCTVWRLTEAPLPPVVPPVDPVT
jgi:transcriptional regulator with XRE-family HTH domain